jgi:hypothetical protein
MLKEDMTCFGPVFECEIEDAKMYILAVYDHILHEAECSREFQSIFDKYAEEETKKQDGTGFRDKYHEEKYIALVFRGKEKNTETVSAVVFGSTEAQVNFCEFINRQKLSDGSFIFAREAEQAREYEIVKPLLARFDQIAGWDNIIIGTALRKADCDTIAAALKGLSEEFRKRIIENLPSSMADKVIHLLDADEKSGFPVLRQNTKQARKKIVNIIITVEKEFKWGNFPKGLEFIKD